MNYGDDPMTMNYGPDPQKAKVKDSKPTEKAAATGKSKTPMAAEKMDIDEKAEESEEGEIAE